MFTTAYTPDVHTPDRTGGEPVRDGDRCRRILVVDDDLETRHMVALKLRRAGYEVTSGGKFGVSANELGGGKSRVIRICD